MRFYMILYHRRCARDPKDKADCSGDTGNLHQRNQQIRNYCLENGKVLYDFYDVECYDPDGNFYGATPVDANPHWYEFMVEPATKTGAELDGNIITLYFVDGERGDDLPIKDGFIIDAGGPGVSASASSGASPSSGGGGCFVSTAAVGWLKD